MKFSYRALFAAIAFVLASVTPALAHQHQNTEARTHSVVYHDRSPHIHAHSGGHHHHQHQSD